MEVLQRVLTMVHQQQRGVLVTVIDADPVFHDWLGRHWIWRGDLVEKLSTEVDQAMLPSPSLAEYPTLPDEVGNQLNRLCEQTLDTGQFRRERVEMAQGWLDLMLEPIAPMPRLVILGCGHIGQALAQMAHWVGWPLTVVDDRPDFANPGLFPAGSEVICGNFSQTIQGLQLAEIDYVVIVTRGHQYDRICLEALAGRPLAYIGMIGSRRRVQGLMEELTKDGLDEQWLRSIHSPIGLDLGGETPEEIAVSIVAEMIQVRRKGAFR